MLLSLRPSARPPRDFARRAVLLAVLSALVALTGCGEKSAAPAAAVGGGGRGGRGGGAAPVIVAQAQRKVVPLVIDAIGVVEPIRGAVIRSQITGVLQRIAIQEGQEVKQGDLLFEIDARPFQNTYASAQADREKIRVQLENARAQLERYRNLQRDQLVSKEQFDQIADTERVLAAQALSSESAVANAKLQLDYCSIRAPVSGRSGNLGVREGDLVRANDLGTMITLYQLNPIYVTFGIPQHHLGSLMRYREAGVLKVRVIPPGGDELADFGELTFVDNTVDPSTGTLKLKGTFLNERRRLWPGQFATVAVTLADPEVLTVPASAIQTAPNSQHVFVVTAEQKAELRPVVVERSDGTVAVIAKGLTEGETVVIDGQLRVISGGSVTVKDPAATGGRSGKEGGAKGKDGKGKGKKKEP
jgi:multidrug efflux system membrane fusion protein